MDKNAIKKYAVWARNELIARVSQKAQQYGITAEGYGDKNSDSVNGVLLSATEKKQRQALIAKIDAEGFEQVMEEVAYTWFNRFTALRFMEVNNYLPSHTRVFTNEANEFKPQILADAISLEIEGLDMDKVFDLKNANKDEELYKYLLIVQCNALSSILPGMFQRIADYTELLLPDYLLREGSVLEQMISIIPEENFDMNSATGQVEIIGWLYQYYISEKHDSVVKIGKSVIPKQEVPAATQLFTTDWVVRYIVDNSIGRYWIERTPSSDLGSQLEYYIDSKKGTKKTVNETIKPQDVTVLDPAVGSGHFLVYSFDVLMRIYLEYGYSEREAAAEIVEHNLFGVDIDGRAAQLAYFAIMMKARQYDRRFFSRNIQPNVHEIIESNNIDSAYIDYFCDDDVALKKNTEQLLRLTRDAKEYGSIIQIEGIDFDLIDKRLIALDGDISLFNGYLSDEFKNLVEIGKILSKKYAVVDTNPPYFNKYDDKLKQFITDNYADYKGDLFSVFIHQGFNMCRSGGYAGFMTPMVWMFIKTYEGLRNEIVNEKSITTLIQFEYSAFEEATVPICSFVLKNEKDYSAGYYFRLSPFVGGMEVQKRKVLEALEKDECEYFFETSQKNYLEITGTPIAYWLKPNTLAAFRHRPIEGIAKPRQGMATSDNNRFLRLWFEIDNRKMYLTAKNPEEAVESGCKWFPYNKGGSFRKWYGNNDYLINWEDDGREVKELAVSLYKCVTRTIKNIQFYFKKGVTWTTLSSGTFCARYCDDGFLFDTKGSTCFFDDEDYILYCTAFLNSNVVNSLLQVLAPTLDYNAGSIAKLPLAFVQERKENIDRLTQETIALSKEDWDSFENSWDFKIHPLVRYRSSRIEDSFKQWEKECEDRFIQLKANEEAINQEFIEIYGLQDELVAEVDEKIITVRKADLERDVKSLISYAVGCMFGRYSLDREGIFFAGGNWQTVQNKSEFVDEDNIIPICDDEYFEDDVVGRFVKFIEIVFGVENLEENLSFIAKALGGKGAARDVIRNYFLNDFYFDHCSGYAVSGSGKRPIYWLFDSGKKNGFKCLIYMHRYQPDTIARIRTDYVHEQQSRYRTAIADLEQRINNASTSERVKLSKQVKILKDQADELRIYEEKIHHLADQMISIDLDDGVKENYAKFQDVLAKIK